MKVCTDSCLFGAWVADKIERMSFEPQRILDIGSGTGLLSLMIAQKSTNSKIDAVEIDERSFLQTKENFRECQWNQRLRPFHADIKTWPSSCKYDLIISNPPFFENDLKSPTLNNNVAKHHDALTLVDLLNSIKKFLSGEGKFAVLLPFHRKEYFIMVAEEDRFYLLEELLVKQTSKHPYFRTQLFFGTKKQTPVSKELIIKEEENYTAPFNYLLKDYYL